MSVDNDENKSENNMDGQDTTEALGLSAIILRLLLAISILGAGISIAAYWLTHRPKAARRRPHTQARLVEVTTVSKGTHRVIVAAMGDVIPAREIQLAARVGGEVIETAEGFIPGGQFAAGNTMLKIAPEDYELAIAQHEAELSKRQAELKQRSNDIEQRLVDIERADIQIEQSKSQVELREAQAVRAQSALKLEMGQQSVAKRQYKLLGQTIQDEDRGLVLRKPQLEAAQADRDGAAASKHVAIAEVKAAEAGRRTAQVNNQAALSAKDAAESTVAAAQATLDRARLDLERTVVRAPFNAILAQRNVDVGSKTAAGTPLATIVGTDSYRVRASVPVGELRWLRIPGITGEEGSPVRVHCETAWGPGVTRDGKIERLMTELERQGRMAQLLVKVEDPLDLKRHAEQRRPLVLGSYVRVEIDGSPLKNVARVPRAVVRNGQQVWIMTDANALDIRDITARWSGEEDVFVAEGLSDGEKLVVSDLATPVQGMALRTADMAPEKPDKPDPLPPGAKPDPPKAKTRPEE